MSTRATDSVAEVSRAVRQESAWLLAGNSLTRIIGFLSGIVAARAPLDIEPRLWRIRGYRALLRLRAAL